jgi:hypothetical protein
MRERSCAIAGALSIALRDLASRVDRNVPHHRDPEQFHIEKSEIASELRRLAARDARRTVKIPANT